MSSKSNPLMVRLPADLMPRFKRLADHYGGLPPATILRMMAASFLECDFDEQVREVDAQIKKPRKKGSPIPGRAGLNSNKPRIS